MMKINFKVRFQNPQFWFQVGLSIMAPILAYNGISGESVNSWPMLFDMLVDAFSNPFIVFTIGVGVYNSLIDNTTPGINDSERALSYTRPADSYKDE